MNIDLNELVNTIYDPNANLCTVVISWGKLEHVSDEATNTMLKRLKLYLPTKSACEDAKDEIKAWLRMSLSDSEQASCNIAAHETVKNKQFPRDSEVHEHRRIATNANLKVENRFERLMYKAWGRVDLLVEGIKEIK